MEEPLDMSGNREDGRAAIDAISQRRTSSMFQPSRKKERLQVVVLDAAVNSVGARRCLPAHRPGSAGSIRDDASLPTNRFSFCPEPCPPT